MAEAHRPGGEAALWPGAFAEHLAVMVALVRQNAVIVKVPDGGAGAFQHLQKAAFGRVQQHAGDVVLPVVSAGLLEQDI